MEHEQLLGTFTHNIDAKGRLALPVSFASAFTPSETDANSGVKPGGYVTVREDYIVLIPAKDWGREQRRINKFPSRLRHRILGLTTYFNPDSQRRLTLSPEVRKMVGISKSAVLIGCGEYVAIYSDDWDWSFSDEDLELMRKASDESVYQ